MAQRAKFIPMRMTKEERDLLLLLEGALEISEYAQAYLFLAIWQFISSFHDFLCLHRFSLHPDARYTNHVDVLSHNRTAIIERELNSMLNFLAGM